MLKCSRKEVGIMNYDLMMEDQIKKCVPGTKLLLHVCCGPCSSTCLERLGNHFEISILYYNPNITDEIEYKKLLRHEIAHAFLNCYTNVKFITCIL